LTFPLPCPIDIPAGKLCFLGKEFICIFCIVRGPFEVAGEVIPMFGIGHQELIIIFGIVFLIFGAKRLPEMGKGLGQAIRGFKKGMEERPQIGNSPENRENESLTPK